MDIEQLRLTQPGMRERQAEAFSLELTRQWMAALVRLSASPAKPFPVAAPGPHNRAARNCTTLTRTLPAPEVGIQAKGFSHTGRCTALEDA